MVYVCIAPGFEEMEATAPIDLLRRAGIRVQTVGIGGKTIEGAHGIPVVCDITDREASADGLEMLVLPGGIPGVDHLAACKTVLELARACRDKGAWTAAICAAPPIYDKVGLLDGKRFTCYPGYETPVANGSYTGAAVERDGKLITARGAGVATAFGLALVEALCGSETAEKIRKGIQCE